jgi:hypothetical protein
MGKHDKPAPGQGGSGSKDGTPTTDVTQTTCNHAGATSSRRDGEVTHYSCSRCGANWTA